jgi:hypothetical protein
MKIVRSNYLIFGLAFLLTLIVFHFSYGLSVLSPQNINWLMSARHDWGTHYLGWAYYRDSPWTFPLGDMGNYNYPVGTNVGYADSIPLLAFIFKIFSGILPEDFQYLGLWLLFCHLMAAYYTVKIFKLYNLNLFYILTGVLLIACNPVLVYRGLHPSLCAHGFILASIYYYLKPSTAANVKQVNRSQVYLLVVSALISPYITLMVVGFNFIVPFKSYFYEKLLSLKQAVIYPIVSCILVLVVWYVFGMLDFSSSVNLEVVNSYGLYGFNLNSFFNSMGYSTYIPALKQVSPHQYEGFLYLGIGVMLLAVIALICFFVASPTSKVFSKIKKHNLPLLFLAVGMAIFAITNKVTYGDQTLFTYPLPEFILKVGGVFRASGRFFWIAYYIFLLVIILVFVKSKLPNYVKVSALVLLLLIQAYDTKLIYLGRDLKSGTYVTPLSNEKWNNIIANFDRVITYPPFNNNLLKPMDYQDLCFLALKAKKPISVGYVARENGPKNQIYIDSLNSNLSKGILFENELIVTTPQHLDAFNVALHNKTVKMHYLDGYYLLYPAKKAIKNDIPFTAEEKVKQDSIHNYYSKSNILKLIDRPAFTDKIEFNIEGLTYFNDAIQIKGWAFKQGVNNNKNDSIFVTISNDKKTYVVITKKVLRPDVTSAFSKENLEDSGFSTTIFTNNIEKGKHDIGIAIKQKSGKWLYADLGQFQDIGKKEFEKPKLSNTLPKESDLIGNIDGFENKKEYTKISGWASFKNQDATNNEIKIVFIGAKNHYTVATEKLKRQDVTTAFKNKYNYDDAGFSVKMKKSDIPKGEYKIGIIVTNLKTKLQFLLNTERVLNNK